MIASHSAIRVWTASTRLTGIHLDPHAGAAVRSQALYALISSRRADRHRPDGAVPPGRRRAVRPFPSPIAPRGERRRRASRLGGTVTSSNALANRMLHRAGADLSMLITETAGWSLSLCRHALVLDAVRPRRTDHGAADAVDRSVSGQGRAALSRPHPGDRSATRAPMPSRARSCTRRGPARWPIWAKCRSAAITAASIPRLCSCFWRRAISCAPAIRRPSARCGPISKRRSTWIDRYGDRDGDGFVEYYRESENGLANQGWKDSHDSIFHADGRLATGPIALCEVQAYVYAAKEGAALMARMLGDHARADLLGEAADELRQPFRATNSGARSWAFMPWRWMAKKSPAGCAPPMPGRCCFAASPQPDRAARLAETLMTPEMFSGWGVRTVASDAPRFNPMSYHNGSVWPHDNALIALGPGALWLQARGGARSSAACSTPPAIWI